MLKHFSCFVDFHFDQKKVFIAIFIQIAQSVGIYYQLRKKFQFSFGVEMYIQH